MIYTVPNTVLYAIEVFVVCQTHHSLASFLQVDMKVSTKSPTAHTPNASYNFKQKNETN